MRKLIIFFVFSITSLSAQPYYTPLRAAFTTEGMGIAPVGAFSADVPLLYRDKSFLNGQMGVGISGRLFYYIRPTFLSGLTYNFLLNPFHKNTCEPAPHYNRWEYYTEAGFGLSVFYPIRVGALPDRLYKNTYLNPSGIIGFRIHSVGEKWIRIFKFRFTPFLDRKFEPWYGFGLGFGWR